MAGAGDGREPNLELPSFFGRRRTKRQEEAPEATPAAEPTSSTGPAAATSTGPATPPEASTPSEPPAAGLRPAARAKRVPPPRRRPPEPPPRTPAQTPAETPAAAAAPADAATPAPAARRPPSAPPATAPVAPAARAGDPAPAARSTEPAPATPAVQEAPRGPEMTYPEDEPTTVMTATRPDDDRVDQGRHDEDDEHAGDGGRPRRRPSVRLPHVAAVPAAALSGAVAALAGVGLGWLALQGCEVVRGVSSCGGGPGLLALLLVVVLEVVVGAAVLRAFGHAQATGTSLVGVGLVVVVAMLAFPTSAITSLAAVVVMPIATAITFVLAHVAATTVVEVESHHR